MSTPNQPRRRRSREPEREARLAALNEQVLAQVLAIRSGEDWAGWLRSAARLRGDSFANVLLIAAQRADATLAATYEQWQALGRQVGKGQRGIQITAEPDTPATSGGDVRAPGRAAVQDNRRRNRPGERLAYVWDVAQTSGTALPARPPVSTAEPQVVWEALTWLSRREGFAVEREQPGRGDGVTIWAARSIRVRPGLGGADAVAALAHELGHVLLHRPVADAPGDSTAGCRGLRKVEADSAAFVVCARLGVNAGWLFPYVASWAGSDPRAQPEMAVLGAGERILVAAERMSAHLDTALPMPLTCQPGIVQLLAAVAPGAEEAAAVAIGSAKDAGPGQGVAVGAGSLMRSTGASPPDDGRVGRALADAERFFLSRFGASWVPGYLRERGFGDGLAGEWRIGYAPAGWTTLTDHLRGLGHDDDAITAAGLARRSSRGSLVDHFRDRAVLAIRDEHGAAAGFIGRARPDAKLDVPKYLNSPDTVAYKKGDLLFGLFEARGVLARSAVPVITEGPFDALAVTIAGGERYVGIAPCGTALTDRQVASLARFADLGEVGVLVALDGDRVGREGAVKAYDLLRGLTAKTTAIVLPEGRDPAEILGSQGPTALAVALRERAQPLATLVVDAWLDQWGRRLEDVAGQVSALRGIAASIAKTLPSHTAERIVQITGGKRLETLDGDLRPRVNPELVEIAPLLPPDAITQIVHLASRLGMEDYSDLLAEVANALIRERRNVRKDLAQDQCADVRRGGRTAGNPSAPQLASHSFPDAPRPTMTAGTRTVETSNVSGRLEIAPVPSRSHSTRPAR